MHQSHSSNVWVWKLPGLGRFHFVKDTAGIIQLSFIVWYWVYGTSVTLWLILFPRYSEGLIPLAGLLVFCLASVMTICSLLKAATTNPGRVPFVDEENLNKDQVDWSHCKVCLRRRPLRSHHCRRCKQCVLRMDHHCPWINNCVGEENHYLFIQLCLWAFILSALTFLLNILHFYFYPKCTVCDPTSWMFYHQRALLYVDTTLGALMSLFMFCMLMTQHLNILLDRTTFENMWDPFPTELPRQKRPCKDIYGELCGPGSRLFWLFPCRRRISKPVYMYYNTV